MMHGWGLRPPDSPDINATIRQCKDLLQPQLPLPRGEAHVFLMREEDPNLMHSCWICTASSRVGASTSTIGPSPLSALALISQAVVGSSSVIV